MAVIVGELYSPLSTACETMRHEASKKQKASKLRGVSARLTQRGQSSPFTAADYIGFPRAYRKSFLRAGHALDLRTRLGKCKKIETEQIMFLS